ncbi:MAG TPA: hypothetical protein VMI13_06450 [Solirubrobacteraceae bacterium]|nr:hypothetical protein [Solirubrobacteraceae bacterium]
MYHVEFRQFPHNFSRFNLTEAELATLLAPWRAGQAIEVGERKWSPHQAKITILEGPELELQELSMGRGWRTAERRSQDVTDRVLAPVQPPPVPHTPAGVAAQPGPSAATAGTPGAVAAAGTPALADPLAALVQIGALLGPEAPRLLDAWRAAAGGDPSLSPSQALAAAEATLRRAGGGSQQDPPEG